MVDERPPGGLVRVVFTSMQVLLARVHVTEQSDLLNQNVDQRTFMRAGKSGFIVLKFDRLTIDSSLLEVVVLARHNHRVELFRAQETIAVQVVELDEQVDLVGRGAVSAVVVSEEFTDFLGTDEASTFTVQSIESGGRREVIDPADVLAKSFKVALSSSH